MYPPDAIVSATSGRHFVDHPLGPLVKDADSEHLGAALRPAMKGLGDLPQLPHLGRVAQALAMTLGHAV
jgi:hypothetical protein